MKINKLIMMLLIIASIILQGNSAYAASSDKSKIDLENITPGYSKEEIQSSSDRVNSFTNTFTGSTVEINDKKDSKMKSEVKKSEVSGQSMIPQNIIISTQQSTGIPESFWGITSNDQWILIENNVPVTGWKMVNNKWYYMNYDGVMQTGWLNNNGNWYYLKSNGEMAFDTVIDGYRINGSGILI